MSADVQGWKRWLETRKKAFFASTSAPAVERTGADDRGGGKDAAAEGAFEGAAAGDGVWSVKSRPLRVLMAIGVLGLLLMTWGGGPPARRTDDGASPASGPSPEPDGMTVGLGEWVGLSDMTLSRALEEALGRIQGVGRVHVLVTLETSARQVFTGEITREKRTQEEGVSGGQRTSREEREQWRPVLVRSQDGRSDAALMEVTEAPRIRGVLVVASGAGDMKVKRAVVRAVEAVTGVGAHRIVVMEGR